MQYMAFNFRFFFVQFHCTKPCAAIHSCSQSIWSILPKFHIEWQRVKPSWVQYNFSECLHGLWRLWEWWLFFVSLRTRRMWTFWTCPWVFSTNVMQYPLPHGLRWKKFNSYYHMHICIVVPWVCRLKFLMVIRNAIMTFVCGHY